MIEKIINIFENELTTPSSAKDLMKYLNLTSSDDFKSLLKTLKELEEKAILVRTNQDLYQLPEKLNYLKGTISIKAKGFGFLIVENKKNDVFIPKTRISDALDKDFVLVKIIGKRKGASQEGEVVKIIKRGTKYLIGTYYEKNNSGHLIKDDKTFKAEVIIEKENSLGAIAEHKVKVEIIKFDENNKVLGKVVEIIGHKNDPGVDILSVVYKYELDTKFSEDVLKQAEMINDLVEEKELLKRKDLRDEIIVTIDGDDAKDLDDAVSVVKLAGGNYKLGVYIADVAHYIKEGTPIDKEAYKRGTSVYLVDRVIPMIPHRLSNGVCSLNPHVGRLVMALEMEINPLGDVVNYEIFEAIIKTNARMTYNNVNKILIDKGQKIIEEYKELVPMFKEMEKLAEILRVKRSVRGAINFETSEAKVLSDESGKPYDIKLRERFVSEKLIEEFMLVANETVASNIFWLGLPFIYRIHEEPNSDKLSNFIKLVRTFGYQIKASSSGVHQTQLQALLEKIAGSTEEKSLNTLLLRSMMKARYSEQPLGHYGLATKYYTHFTSPIRRYPDTIVHRLLKEYIINKNIIESTILSWEKKLPAIGLHTSKKERGAISCEREVLEMKKAEYMEDKIGLEAEGIITGITNFGLFVELPNTVEGLVHVFDLKDDYYEFNPDLMVMVGRRKKTVFRIGDLVKIKVISASKEAREVSFKIIEVIKGSKKKDDKKEEGRFKKRRNNRQYGNKVKPRRTLSKKRKPKNRGSNDIVSK